MKKIWLRLSNYYCWCRNYYIYHLGILSEWCFSRFIVNEWFHRYIEHILKPKSRSLCSFVSNPKAALFQSARTHYVKWANFCLINLTSGETWLNIICHSVTESEIQLIFNQKEKNQSSPSVFFSEPGVIKSTFYT